MPVTQRDVAARANVSPMVVSHVLHKRASTVRVSEATAQRVREAAEELGYRCNVFARNFRSQRTEMIGVVHGIEVTRPRFDRGPRYFASLMDGIVEGAFKKGYSVALCPKLLGEQPDEATSDGRFDGLVWYNAAPCGKNREWLDACRVPVVIVHGTASEFPLYPTVICDNAQGTKLAVDHLTELGHRNLAFGKYHYYRNNLEVRRREEVFLSHCTNQGVSGNTIELGTSLEEQELAVQKLIENGVTGLVLPSDELAAAMIRAASAAGISVPGQLSVVGFDSSSFCDELTPRLTSVHQPLAKIGEIAIDLLIQPISDRNAEPQHVVVPCCLDVRDSTCPPAQ